MSFQSDRTRASAYAAPQLINPEIVLTAADERAVDTAIAAAEERGDRPLSREAIRVMLRNMKAIGLQGINLDGLLSGRKTRLTVSYE